MNLPFIVSLPHAGTSVPDELKDLCIISPDEIAYDGDLQAREIYSGLRDICAEFIDTPIGRAFVDLNRAEDDIRLDGVVKTHTVFNKPIYNRELPDKLIKTLIEKYWRPYHQKLTELSGKGARLGLDCHTMLAEGPPVGPDPGKKRPAVCIGNADGTCPDEWAEAMAECFRRAFAREVRVNDPFRGGYIIRSHTTELPWMQIEISRGNFMSVVEKSDRTLSAIMDFVGRYFQL